jgi:hypothetical protein
LFLCAIGLDARFVVEYERDFVSVSCDEEERGDGWEEGVSVVGCWWCCRSWPLWLFCIRYLGIDSG